MSSDNPFQTINAIMLALIGLTCIANAIIAWHVFWPWRRMWYAKLKSGGFIGLAIALGIFNFVSRVPSINYELRLAINSFSLFLVLVVMLVWFVGFIDLLRHR